MTALRWTRLAPGSYQSTTPNGLTLRVYRECDCGRCSPWVVVLTDDETGWEVGRWSGHHTMGAARYWAANHLLAEGVR